VAENVWLTLLDEMRGEVDEENFRRWFGASALASDAGDQITVWVPTESIRRHINAHYIDHLQRVLAVLGRSHTDIRFVVVGYGDDDDEDDS
jgi:chromosomal replication initiation ATPase DnaA